MRVSKLIFSDDFLIVPYIALIVTILITLGLKLSVS